MRCRDVVAAVGPLCVCLLALAGCQPTSDAATEAAASTRQRLAPAGLPAAAPPASVARAAHVVALADTVAPGSILVNDLPLVVRREVLRQQLGPADSTYAATTPAQDPNYCFGDEQQPDSYPFERYRASCYWQQGDTLTFLQTYRGAAPLRVQIGPHHLSERTTLADLQRLFPASYRHALHRETNGQQLLTLYPPAAEATDTWYTLVIEKGRVAQFLHVFNCTYD